MRFASLNASLFRSQEGRLAADLSTLSDPQAQKIAAILQFVRPHVVLINEFDHDAQGQAADAFNRYLRTGQFGQTAIPYEHRFHAPVNTGLTSGLDVDRNGRLGDPADAQGYGAFPGQYGMLVLSQFPIDRAHVRTFQRFLWRDMPQAKLPQNPDGSSFYGEDVLAILRLSSKSHWDLPIQVGDRSVHLLCSHPTPPVFDGVEDRNGTRNHDEIRFWADYVDAEGGNYMVDDAGRSGGLPPTASFVLAGDLNADPHDGDSIRSAIRRLTSHPRIHAFPVPTSRGAVLAARNQGGKNAQHDGDPAADTADFEDRRVGNLRIDYVLVSKSLRPVRAGVFWPPPGEIGRAWIDATDHRLVWVDLRLDGLNDGRREPPARPR